MTTRKLSPSVNCIGEQWKRIKIPDSPAIGDDNALPRITAGLEIRRSDLYPLRNDWISSCTVIYHSAVLHLYKCAAYAIDENILSIGLVFRTNDL
jgi:hypothetical protein